MENREVFISYHTDSSSDTARKICAALEGAGISCWYAPRDVEANYANSIVRAIRSCKVFLLLLNEQSNLSAHVLNEINCAFDRFKNHEEITLLPFRMDECTLSDDVYYYLGRIHIMDGHLPPEVLRIQELVARICSLLGKEPDRTVVVQDDSGTFHSADTPKQYRLIGTIVYPDTRFVGRKKELCAVAQQMASIPNKLALVGMGGIGKSEIARMYLKTNADQYDVILWVSFEESLQKTLVSDFLFPIEGFSVQQFPQDSERDYFLRKLQLLKQIADHRVLIVIDNFDVTDDPDLELFCSGTYGVLFTTRYHQNCSSLPEIQVEGILHEEDLLTLFRSEYHRELNDQALACVKQIVRLLQGHPLSIRLVANTMQSRRLSPEKMYDLLQIGVSAMQTQNAKAADLIYGNLRQVFTLSALTEQEQYLLKNLSLISLRGIEVETFFDWCGADDFDIIDGLIAKSWVIHDPVTDSVHLHPLVAQMMAQELEQDLSSCDQLVEAIHRACRVDIHYTWEKKLQLHDMAQSLYARLPKTHKKFPLACKARAQLIFSMAHYEEAAHLFLQILPFAETLEEKLFLYVKASHAFVLGSLGEEGKNTALEGLSLLENIALDDLSPKEGDYYKALLCRMLEAYEALGDYTTAIEYGRKAEAICDRFIVTSYEMNRGWVEFHLAAALYYAGETEEAEKTIRHAIELFEQIEEAWSLNYCYDILGLILARKGAFEEALALNTRAAEILRPLYGTEHADIAKNLEYRAMIHRAMGEKETADGYFRQAIELYQRLNCHMRVTAVQKAMEE